MIDWIPDPIFFSIGPIDVYWYGVMYALGLAATFLVIEREARRRRLDVGLLVNGMIIVAVAALVGGRLYHVIDQWELYKDDLLSIVLPPYSGLGVYGGIVTGFIVGILYVRWKRQPVLTWTDVAVPGLLTMQAIARWGNFFNQELYGPPTDLPWGITIDCAHRVPLYPCETYPVETTGFHPLFLYESLSGALGAVTLLWIARRYGRHMRPGDLWLMFLIWYSAVRLVLETLRTGNWTAFGVPVAMLVSVAVIVVALVVLAWRHRPAAVAGDRWGDERVPVDGDEWVEVDEDEAGESDAVRAENGDGASGEGEGDGRDDGGEGDGGADHGSGSGDDGGDRKPD